MTNIQDELKKHENDTGSAEVQIASLTATIKILTEHLTENKKDFSGKRGLFKKLSQRKRFLKYLKNSDPQSYLKVIEVLGLKK